MREVMKSDSSAREITPPAPMVELLREQKARVLAMALKWGRDISAIRYSCSPASRAHRCSRRTYCTACDRSYAARRSSALRRAMRGGTSATQLLDGGQNIKTVQTRLGHASPATTLALYVHPVEKRDREAADLLGALLKP